MGRINKLSSTTHLFKITDKDKVSGWLAATLYKFYFYSSNLILDNIRYVSSLVFWMNSGIEVVAY